jgi:hypothetical protein
LVPRISADNREDIATPAASSEAELIRIPVDNLSIEVSTLRLTLLAAAAACSAPLFVAIAKAIRLDPLLHANSRVEAQILFKHPKVVHYSLDLCKKSDTR